MSGQEAQDYWKISAQTLRRYDKAKKVLTRRSPGNQRIYAVEIDSLDVSDESEIEASKEIETQRSEIEAKIARYKKHLGKDTLLGRVAEISIPSLEKELERLQ